MLTCCWWFTWYYLSVIITSVVLACMSINSTFKIEHMCLQFFLHPIEATFSHVLWFSFDVMLDVGVLAQPCPNCFKWQDVFWVLVKSWPWSAAGCSTKWKCGKSLNNIAGLKKRGCSRQKQVFPFDDPIFHMRNWSPFNNITPHMFLSLHGTAWNLVLKKKNRIKKKNKEVLSHASRGQIKQNCVSH